MAFACPDAGRGERSRRDFRSALRVSLRVTASKLPESINAKERRLCLLSFFFFFFCPLERFVVAPATKDISIRWTTAPAGFFCEDSATKFGPGVVPLRLLRPPLYAGKLVGIMFLWLSPPRLPPFPPSFYQLRTTYNVLKKSYGKWSFGFSPGGELGN